MGQTWNYIRGSIHTSTGPLYSNTHHIRWDKLHINTIPTGDTPYSDGDSAVLYKPLLAQNIIYTVSDKCYGQTNRKLLKDGTQKETLRWYDHP